MTTINCVKGFDKEIGKIITHEHIISWNPYQKMSKDNISNWLPSMVKAPVQVMKE